MAPINLSRLAASRDRISALASASNALLVLIGRYDAEKGCWVLKGRFTPEQGAVIRQVLEKAMDALFDERADEHPDVSAETSRRLACDAAVVRSHEDANGEPLSIGRKSRTIPPAIRRALQKRDGGCRFPVNGVIVHDGNRRLPLVMLSGPYPAPNPGLIGAELYHLAACRT